MRTVLIWAATAFVAITAQQVSTNGRCGIGFGNRVCRGSSYGNCCSQYNYCGSTSGHCGTGCQPNFGTCSASGSSTLRTLTISSTRSSSTATSSTRSSSIPIASPVNQVSRNGRCGYSNGAVGGFTCKGSAYGNCCSQYSYCGSTSGYCGTGCQPGFGTCSGISSSVRSSSSTSLKPSSTASSSMRTTSASSSISPVASSTQVSSSTVSSSTTTSSSLSTTSSASTSPPSSTSSSISSQATTTTPSPTPIESTPSSSSSTPLPSPTPPAQPLQLVTNPSFELGTASDPTSWTIERLYIIDAAASGRFASNPHTGTYAIRGRGQLGGGYDVTLSQTVTVVPGSSYNIEVYAKQTTSGFCSLSIYLSDRAVREFAPPGTTYTSISAVVDIGVQEAVQQVLLVDGACSLPNGGSAEMYDLFIDDVSMTVVV